MERKNVNLDAFMQKNEDIAVNEVIITDANEPTINVETVMDHNVTREDTENVQKPVSEQSAETGKDIVPEATETVTTKKDRGNGEVNVIAFKNLTQIFNKGEENEYKLFENFSLNIPDFAERGQLVSIMGASGCGKTRLVRVLCGLDSVQSGTCEIYGKEVTKDMAVPMIFQNCSNFEWFTVLQNVMLPMTVRGISKDEAEKKAMELLKLVGLDDRASQYPHRLSGGQQQRVSIARCLACDSQIIVFDEATSALDLTNKRAVQDTILDIFYDYEKDPTILNISHSVEEVAYISNRVIILQPNPCNVYKVIDIHYPGEDDKHRGDWIFDTQEYTDYVKEITKSLKEIC